MMGESIDTLISDSFVYSNKLGLFFKNKKINSFNKNEN
jgi:hypothetical protein